MQTWYNAGVLKKTLKMVLYSLLIFTFLVVLTRLLTLHASRGKIHSISGAPIKRAAVVFGAGLNPDGSPTRVLRDRVITAARLYEQGKIEKILMSGDNRFIDYNEPGAMKEYAVGLGIPEGDIVLDYAGRRTYDTCYRARAIFQLDDVLLVTQRFHLPRALYTCRQLGLQAVGVAADRRPYHQDSLFFWNIRELAATSVAWLQVHITHPEPVLGSPEPIFPSR